MPESPAVLGRFLKYRLNAGDFVSFASHINAGDRPRVDFDQIKIFPISLPPPSEQPRIADALDELFSDLDAGVAALERVRDKLKLYRASVLKAAVDGTLTAEWREKNPEGRWRCYEYDDLLKRDKLSLDLFWIKDKSLTDTDSLPAPDILATEIADDLESALDQFTKIAARLNSSTSGPHKTNTAQP